MENAYGKIERVKVPDQDVAGWLSVLREGGFTDEEMDGMLSRLNPTFGMKKLSPQARKEFEGIVNNVEKRLGKQLTEEDRESLFDALRSQRRSL